GARAGSSGPRHGAPPVIAWLATNSGEKTHRVATRAANDFGLHDMIGNVYEWCEDTWHFSYVGAPSDGSAWLDSKTSERVFRGGAWNDTAGRGRSANRGRKGTGLRYNNLGFRPASLLR
ncbi:MAG: sulfatase activating formylglycine-generating enzyme, partial [Pseudohongiellaceae bacterium]